LAARAGSAPRHSERREGPWCRGGADLEELIDTYRRYDDLRKADRNTIWSYVARNLSRPLYLAAEERRVDVLVGNPPWLALRHMSDDLHTRFKDLAKGENIYVGGKLATQNDVSLVLRARCCAQARRTCCLRDAACGNDARAV
jgi:hypothetical protein